MNSKDDKKTVQIKITITEDEYNILRNLSELQGKPSATVFIDFVRESNIFGVLQKVAIAGNTINKWKSIFKSKNKEIIDEMKLDEIKK